MKQPQYQQERTRLAAGCRRFASYQLGVGASGNLSSRVPDGMLITPTGVVAGEVEAEQLVLMSLDGTTAPGQLRPSSEWPMHARLYAGRDTTQAVVHCHSRHATILACAGRSIPAVHYMIAAAGCRNIAVAPYATFGTHELADGAMATMGNAKACLLAHHGQLTVGNDIIDALDVAQQVEELAAIYLGCLTIGSGEALNDQHMSDVEAAFQHYGQQADVKPR